MSRLTVRSFAGLALVAINIIAYFIMLNSRELIGDVSGFPVENFNDLHIAFLSTIITFFFFLFFYFNYLSSLSIKPITFKNSPCVEKRIGWLILALQVLFFYFNLSNGVNVSGSGNKTTDSIWGGLWVFVAPDLLFIIYYGFYRDSSLFKANLTVAIISSLFRGRGGIVLLIVFMELSRLVRRKNISLFKLSIPLAIIFLCYPLLNILKFTFRLYFGDGSLQSADYYLISVANGILDGGYLNAVYAGFEHVIGRLQVVSIVSEIYRLSNVIIDGSVAGQYFPFWKEGLHGIIWDRLSGEARNFPLGTYFTEIGRFSWDFTVGDWNTNPGLAGWLVILSPLEFIGFFIYIGTLGFLSVLFTKLTGKSDMSLDMLWFSWAFYLMPAWLSVFVLFVFSLFIFLMFKVILSLVPPLKIFR